MFYRKVLFQGFQVIKKGYIILLEFTTQYGICVVPTETPSLKQLTKL